MRQLLRFNTLTTLLQPIGIFSIMLVNFTEVECEFWETYGAKFQPFVDSCRASCFIKTTKNAISLHKSLKSPSAQNLKFLLAGGPVQAETAPAVAPTTSVDVNRDPAVVDSVVESGVPDFASSGESKDDKKTSSTSQHSPKSTSTVETNLVTMNKPGTSHGLGTANQHSDDDNDDQLSDQIKTEGGECKYLIQHDLWPP